MGTQAASLAGTGFASGGGGASGCAVACAGTEGEEDGKRGKAGDDKVKGGTDGPGFAGSMGCGGGAML